MSNSRFLKMGLAIPFAVTVASVYEKAGSSSIAAIVLTVLFAVYCLYVVASIAFEKEDEIG